MPRSRRIQYEGAFYHVYNRGNAKGRIVLDNQDRRAFFRFLADTVSEFHLRLFAHCLMDNHFHLFMQVPLANLGQAMQKLQGRYAQYTNLRHDRVGSLFQGRFKSRLVETDPYAQALVRYIHRNPVEAGIVTAPENYPWSSYAGYIGKPPRVKWLEVGWLLSQFSKEPGEALTLFEAFHRLQSPEQELRTLKCMSRPLTGDRGV